MTHDKVAARSDGYRPSKALWFWSCIVCLVVPILFGFLWGGWLTQSAAMRMADGAGKQARAELAAAYCVSRFERAPDVAAQLAVLQKTESWDRAEFIAKGGWTKVPGQDKAVDGAADMCARRLMASEAAKEKST
jgi:hypothetical protein